MNLFLILKFFKKKEQVWEDKRKDGGKSYNLKLFDKLTARNPN